MSIKQSIVPDNYNAAPGFYSPAIKVDLGNAEMIFVTGQQINTNENGEVATTDIAEQTEYVFEQLQKTLHAAGSSLDDVVKAQIFLTDINDFPVVSEIRKKYFAKSKPASTLVEVNAMVHKGAKIEIEVIAVREK
ncbi:RidA family protein [Candidatus Saccharibacteria bacterium]|nr:RidA family protein [Candidatus Saccharibacteria bacterium]MCL1962783.1 RidA family protein [Candidatus Saccharibacteria bacterium]